MKYPKFRESILPLLLLALVSSCVPQTRKVVPSPEIAPPKPLLLSIETVEREIAYLTRILEEEGRSEEDKAMASELLKTYKAIRPHLQDPALPRDEGEIIQRLLRSLGRLEAAYFLKQRWEGPNLTRALALFSQKRKEILEAYAAGDYRGVINECVDMEATFGPEALTPEIGLLFSVSLAKKGMLEEALIISEKIVREMEGKPELTHLRAHIIRWQLHMGNREKAQQIYEKMMDEVGEKQGLLSSSKRLFTEKSGLGYDKPLPLEPPKALEKPFGSKTPTSELLRTVEELIQRHEFKEAKLLLIKQRIRSEEGPELETIDQALKSVDLAEERYRWQKKAQLDQERAALTLARKLIDEENYEEAITKISGLRDEEDLTPEMQELKSVATEKLINRERNRAAKYFLMAMKTEVPERREALLRSSYEILEGLIEAYPSSNLIEKLNDNLQRVKGELDKLGKGPTF